MASSQPTSPAQRHYSDRQVDTIWGKTIFENEEAVVNDLRRISTTVLRSCKEHTIITDKDFIRLQNLKPERKIKEIISTVAHGDKQTYEVFRDILKGQKKTALHSLLDVANKELPDKSTKGPDEGNYLKDLRDELRVNNLKMDSVMEAVKRVEQNQAEEIKRLRSNYEQRQQECNKLKKTNTALQSKISELNQKLKQNKGSGDEVMRLENELKERRNELRRNGESKTALETEVADLRNKIMAMEAEMASDSAASKI